jgi:hypothetical protein
MSFPYAYDQFYAAADPAYGFAPNTQTYNTAQSYNAADAYAASYGANATTPNSAVGSTTYDSQERKLIGGLGTILMVPLEKLNATGAEIVESLYLTIL